MLCSQLITTNVNFDLHYIIIVKLLFKLILEVQSNTHVESVAAAPGSKQNLLNVLSLLYSKGWYSFFSLY